MPVFAETSLGGRSGGRPPSGVCAVAGPGSTDPEVARGSLVPIGLARPAALTPGQLAVVRTAMETLVERAQA